MRVRSALVLAAGLALVGCGLPPDPTPAPEVLPSTATSAASPPPEPAGGYPVTAAELGASWRPGCPVGPEQLRRLVIDYLGFDGVTRRGELIVHEDLVGPVREMFADLHRLRFPIDKIRVAARYPGAEDELSMRDNNTSAFNCRGIPGSDSWSEHAYGRAIDINPLLNPYISTSGRLEPATAGPFLDRARTDPGMLHDGDPAVRVFTDRGWTWGGHWRNPKDYQHFELPAPPAP